jgi:hypothetical protein
MKFAKIIFWIAGGWGLLVLTPLYFMFDRIGRQDPPPITHPQFYFGFVGAGIAWQVAFLLIAIDPARLRPMIVPAILEKLSYSCAAAILYIQGRASAMQSATAIPDAILFLLFVAAFVKSAPVSANPRPPIPMNVRMP